MMGNRPTITLYRWAGRKLFWKIGSECLECDRSIHSIQELLETEFSGVPIRFEIKNWLDHLFEALWRGAFHPPVILLNGRPFSQGVVPDRDRLRQAIQQLLAPGRGRCPVCDRILDGSNSARTAGSVQHELLKLIVNRHPELPRPRDICVHCLRAHSRLLMPTCDPAG